MSGRRLMNGVTVVVITTSPSSAKAKETGIIATAELCFGSDLADVLCCVDYVQTKANTVVWRMPAMRYLVNGKAQQRPVFQGNLAIEIADWAALGLDRVKKQFGNMKWGRVYTVPVGSASTVDEALSAAKAATGGNG